MCVNILGRISAPCNSCVSTPVYQVPLIYHMNPYQSGTSLIPTHYRVDTLFYAVHMNIFKQDDPISVSAGFTSPDPIKLMVPQHEQGEPTYLQFKHEPLPHLRYTNTTCDRAYPDVNHPRRRIMHCLLMDENESLFHGASYIPLLQTMIDEWRTSAFMLREHVDYLSEFNHGNGDVIVPAVAAVQVQMDDDEDDSLR